MASDKVTLTPRKEGHSKNEARTDVAAVNETEKRSTAASSRCAAGSRVSEALSGQDREEPVKRRRKVKVEGCQEGRKG